MLAVERLFQAQYRYRIGNTFLPIGLEIGRSTEAETGNAGAFSRMVSQFGQELDTARTTLETVQDTAFVWDVNAFWLDVNADGIPQPNEYLVHLLAELMDVSADATGPADQVLEIRFDAADKSWLLACTHVLSGGVEGLLALIAERDALLQLIENEQEYLPVGDETLHRLKVIQIQREGLHQRLPDLPDGKAKQSVEKQLKALSQEETRLRNKKGAKIRRPDLKDRISRIESQFTREPGDVSNGWPGSFTGQSGLEAIYLVITVLKQQPDPARLLRMRDHWAAMLVHNVKFWASLATETDNDQEWIPNPDQINAFGLSVDAQTVQAWQDILAEAQDVLEGQILIPHPFLPRDLGIGLAAWVESPTQLDLTLWLHGRAAYPYLARGYVISDRNWRAFRALTAGRTGNFAPFFN